MSTFSRLFRLRDRGILSNPLCQPPGSGRLTSRTRIRERQAAMSWNFQSVPDALLVERLYAGDREAWEALYRRYHPQLIEFLHGRVWRVDGHDALADQVWLAVRGPAARKVAAYDLEKECFLDYLLWLADREVVRVCKQNQRRALRWLFLNDEELVGDAAEEAQQ